MATGAALRARIDQVMLSIEVDEALLTRAAVVLGSLGLTVEDAVRLLFAHLAEHGSLPDDLKVPNAATRDAMAETDRLLLRGMTIGARR